MASTSNTLRCVLLVVCVITATVDGKPKVKPINSYFKICSRSNQKELNECVKDAVTGAKPLLAKGIPALGLPPLEPLVIPRLEMVEGQGSFTLRTILTDFTIRGMSSYTVQSANVVFDKDNVKMDMGFTFPTLNSTAGYEMGGKVLVIPIQGKGTCEMDYVDVAALAHTIGRIVKRNGREFIEIVNIKWDLAINGKARFLFHNLFNGDKRLGDATNNFLNDSQQEAFLSVKHLPEEAFAELFKGLATLVFDVYSLDELFLD